MEPLRLIVERRWKKATYTIGRLYVDGRIFCNTLEDTDRILRQTDSLQYIREHKVYGETAIPTGTYEVVFSLSEKFKNRTWAKRYGGKVPELLDVKGFSGIRIHPFNSPEESFGCIGPGENRVVGKIVNSTRWYYKLIDSVLLPAWNLGRKVYIEVI